MAQFEKHFTLDEANALLPELRDLLRGIQSVRTHLVVDLERAAPVLQLSRSNGGGQETSGYLTRIHELNDQLGRLAELGIQLKDIDRGLIDFPAWRGEQEVFLCWHLDEDDVRYWHDLESGYAGRQPW